MPLDNTPDDTLAGKLGTSIYNTDANLQDFGTDNAFSVTHIIGNQKNNTNLL